MSHTQSLNGHVITNLHTKALQVFIFSHTLKTYPEYLHLSRIYIYILKMVAPSSRAF
jgi:hypothetical protein